MFEEVIQLVLRNRGSQGYETLYSSSEVEIDNDLLPYLLPRSKTSPSFPNYFFKYPINSDSTLVKLVQDDGVDPYNRFKAKVILFIIPNTIYSKNNGLLFFASPLWLNTISLEKDGPLDYLRDFDVSFQIKEDLEKTVNQSFLAFLLDKMLFYENLLLMIEDTNTIEQDRIFLNQLIAYLDHKLPSLMRNQITIKTLTNKNFTLANCLLLDHYDKDLSLGENYYVLPISKKLLEKDSAFETSKLAKSLLAIKTEEERELIGRSLLNGKTLLKEELVTSNEYTKLVNRFNFKNAKLIYRFFRNIGLK